MSEPPFPPPPPSSPSRPTRAHVPRSPPPATPLRSPPPGGAGPGPKRVIYTGAFAAVTIVGAIYGAGLKTQQEYKAEKTKIIEATPEQRIEQLQVRRSALVNQRVPIQRKLDEIQERIRVAEVKEQQQGKR